MYNGMNIVAMATPPDRAIGMIRWSGDKVFDIQRSRPYKNLLNNGKYLHVGSLKEGPYLWRGGDLNFKAPSSIVKSYRISCHGSACTEQVLGLLFAMGPGSKAGIYPKGFMNGKSI